MSFESADALYRNAFLAALCCGLAAALAPSPAHAGVASTVYVDVDGTCDYPSLQDAIDDLVPGSEIRLVGAEFTFASSVVVFNRQLRIAGGYPACGAPAASGKTTLRATFSGAPLLSAGGNLVGAFSLVLADLVLTGADNPTGHGGALQATGMGQLGLSAVDVVGNHALSGGGVYVSETGGLMTLNLLDGSRIGTEDGPGNTAGTGAGVFCAQARMRLGHADIMSNTASGQGGGMYADGCEVFSTEATGDLRIEHNHARDGGGIYATGQTQLTLDSRPLQKISVSHNEASQGAPPQRGGGIFLNSPGSFLEASGVSIDNNLARGFGGGLMLVASEAVLNRETDGCSLGDEGCSSLSGNEVRDEAGALTGSGAALFVAGTGTPVASLVNTRMVGNAAAGSIVAVGDAAQVAIESTLIATNMSSGALFQVFGSATVQGDLMTVADNLVTTDFQVDSDAALALQLSRSIVLAVPGAAHLSGPGTVSVSCLNTGTGGALGGTAHDPGFASAQSGNYRLTPGSQNLDRCAATGSETAVDIAGYPRLIDRSDTPNGEGEVDRGAYEDTLILVHDGFED